jgi:hypothetical protein
MSRRPIVPLLLLLAACAPATQTVTTGSGPMAGPAMAQSGIMGSYTLMLSGSDLPASAPEEMRTGAPGTWGLAFHEGNHYVVSHNGESVVQGAYQVNGDQVMFDAGDTGQYACHAPATYAWRRNDGQLTFTLVGADPCMGRTLALTTRPYTRTP